MKTEPARTAASEVVSINERAIDNIRFIRETMEKAGSFTDVPGYGGMCMGVTALAAAAVASRAGSPEEWVRVWLVEAMIAVVIGLVALLRKARSVQKLLSGPGRTFALNFCPAMAAGLALSVALYAGGLFSFFPGTWLLLYGVAVVAGGAYSVRVVPVMGLCFMAVGVMALFVPAAWGNTAMAVGFGGLHIGFGGYIARRHGG